MENLRVLFVVLLVSARIEESCRVVRDVIVRFIKVVALLFGVCSRHVARQGLI